MTMQTSLPSTISFWLLGWRTLWRDMRAGELRMLVLAVALAVAALSAVAFFSDRLHNGLRRDAAQLLGGDVVVHSDQPTPRALQDKATALGLRGVHTETFPTMARAADAQGGEARLVVLKAVDDGYPLRGTVGTGTAAHWQPEDGDTPMPHGPRVGEVWPEPALLRSLNLQVGDMLHLGESSLRITRVLVREPDRGGSLVSFAPRVLMHLHDLPATQLVQPASRVTYRLALVGNAASVRAYTDWAQARIRQSKTADNAANAASTAAHDESPETSSMHGVRLETLDEGNPQMQKALARAGNFLNLVALLTALLSAVTVALAARGFAARHLDDCAMLRVLGLPQRTIAASYALEFILLGLLGSALGLLLGFVSHYAFVALLGALVQTTLPAPGGQPVLLGLGVGLTLLLAFGLPPVLQLAETPPLRVIRRDVGALKATSAAALLLGASGFALLLLASSRDLRMGALAVGGFAVAVLLFAVLGAAAVLVLRRMSRSPLPRWLLLVARQLAARPVHVVVQTCSLALGLLALILLVLLRTDLIHAWQQSSPPDAPNRFVINIMPEQADAFRDTLHRAGIAQYDWYPMVRGRLIAINGQAIAADRYPEERAQRLVEREFNLSYAARPPAYNPVSGGAWHTGDANAISMEEGIMQTLGLHLGDTLLFDMGGVQRSSRITSVRKVDWGSMHVNFFAMYPLAELDESLPVTYIAAYRAPASTSFERELLQQYPNITHIDLTSTIAQVRQVLDQVIAAVELLFGFGLSAGLVVLFATLEATREERTREIAIMRALGAGSPLLRRMQNAELLAIGALAGTLAAVVALVLAWLLAAYVFEFDWAPAWWALPAAAITGALLAWLAGWWNLRTILHRPVVATLRAATQE